MSANSGRAPARRMALALAKKVKGLVMTASGEGAVGALEVLLPMPAAASASQIASVPLAQPMAKDDAQIAAAAVSNAATCGPRMKLCESQTQAIASSISCRSGVNWREKSSIGTDCETAVGTLVMVQRVTLETFCPPTRQMELAIA